VRNLAAIVLVAFGAGVALRAEAAPPTPSAAPSPLEPLRFLVGTWTGEGEGQPGRGSGSASFGFDLGGRVLLRRSHSEYPALGDRPAAEHDDLMVIYPAPGTGKLEAVYLDNEGHTIRYGVEVKESGNRVVLESEPRPSSPTFRLVYVRVAEGVVDVTFAIAPPGKPDSFEPYVSGRTRRAER